VLVFPENLARNLRRALCSVCKNLPGCTD